MIWRLMADGVVIAHALFVVFALFGALLVLRWRRVAWLHVPAVAWAVVVEWRGWICPLTPLEHRLRELGGIEAYRGDFIDHYVIPLLYPPGLTRSTQLVIGSVILLLNVAIYAWIWRRRMTHG